jgi:hypothetical protein
MKINVIGGQRCNRGASDRPGSAHVLAKALSWNHSERLIFIHAKSVDHVHGWVPVLRSFWRPALGSGHEAGRIRKFDVRAEQSKVKRGNSPFT